MKKTKIERRIENVFNAFFDEENLNENNSLVYSKSADLAQKNASEVFVEKADTFLKILKQFFLFFPGTIGLFNICLILAIVTLRPPLYTFVLYPTKLIIALLVSSFMTMFGLGNIQNFRHLIIPASVILVAFLSGSLISTFYDGLASLDLFAMYLLPLALVTPIVAKGWIDKTDKNFDGV